MAAVELESRAAVAFPSLASSFLPKCTHFLQAKQANCSSATATFHGVVASTKQKKKGRKSSSPARNWSYEHFMVLWDEVFEHCCTDPVKATQIRDLAFKGLTEHGRGCVLVFQEVQTRPRGSGTGFTSKPPKSSRRVPDFDTLDYHAVYLPREFLLDPRKAPLEEDVAGREDTDQPDENASRVVVEKQGDDGNVAIDTVERQHKDRNMVPGDGGDKVIDIEEIIRDAQDVYSFYSDDEDELDAATDDDDEDSVIGLDDREGDTNTAVSQLNLDSSSDKGNSVAVNVSDNNSLPSSDGEKCDSTHLLIFYDDNDSTPVIASELCGKHEDPLLTSNGNEVEPSVTMEMQHEEDINVHSGPISPDISSVDKYTFHDAVHGTKTNTQEANIDNYNEYHNTTRVAELTLDDGSNSLKSALGMGEGVELHEKDSNIMEVQVEKNGGTHNACDARGSVGTSVPTVELLNESFKADTVEPTALVPIGKGELYHDNKGRKDDGVEIATQQMLYAAMRGMDRTRLLSLTANFDFEIPKFRLKRRMAVIDVKTMDAGGEDPYNPKQNELVLLLHLLMDGKPTYGADVLVAYRDEGNSIGEEKNYWKLRGKHRNIFA